MAGFIEGVDGSQSVLFQDRLDDWISEDSLVRVVDLFVEELDLPLLCFSASLLLCFSASLLLCFSASPARPLRGPGGPAITQRCCSSCSSTVI
jgi:hypothetical protein